MIKKIIKTVAPIVLPIAGRRLQKKLDSTTPPKGTTPIPVRIIDDSQRGEITKVYVNDAYIAFPAHSRYGLAQLFGVLAIETDATFEVIHAQPER